MGNSSAPGVGAPLAWFYTALRQRQAADGWKIIEARRRQLLSPLSEHRRCSLARRARVLRQRAFGCVVSARRCEMLRVKINKRQNGEANCHDGDAHPSWYGEREARGRRRSSNDG